MKAHRIILLPHLSERLASNILRNIVLLSLTLRHLMYHLVPSFSQLHIASCYLPHTIALSLPHADVIPLMLYRIVLLTLSHCPSHTYASSFCNSLRPCPTQSRRGPPPRTDTSRTFVNPLYLTDFSPIRSIVVPSPRAV